jgi:arylsulfatase A-like enzyme
LHATERHLAGLLHDAGYYSALAHIQHETTRPGQMGYDCILQESDFGLERVTGPARRPTVLASEFFKSRRGNDQPFFLQVGYFEPHRVPGSPDGFGSMPPDESQGVWVPPYLVDDEGSRREMAAFQGAIRPLDDGVGEVLRALDDNGLRENTIVIFTTDHGIPFPRAKCSVYDPGLETCLLVRWPAGGWSGGRVYNGMVPHIDLLPTLLETCCIPLPEGIHGRSFAPLLNREEYVPRDHFFAEMTYHDYYDPVRCIRTETHKLLVYFCYNVGFMDPSQSWRPGTITVEPPEPIQSRHALVELYDLRDDPLEHRNLASDEAHVATRRELLQRLYAWMQETNDPLLHGVPPSPMHLRALAALRAA